MPNKVMMYSSRCLQPATVTATLEKSNRVKTVTLQVAPTKQTLVATDLYPVLQVINNRVYVRGHKYVLGLTQTHFRPSRYARVKVSSDKGSKCIYTQETNLY